VIKATLRLLRVKQYTKNSFIFVPLIFSQATLAGIVNNLPNSLIAFAAFCLISSSAYILNDLFDLEKDKLHPVKAKRPLASGELSVSFASGLLFLTLAAAIALSLLLSLALSFVIIAYLLNNLFYSFYLKQYALFDIFSLSLGFLLRVFAGAVAIKVPVSAYLFLVVFFLSLYLGAGKRRYELLLLGENSDGHRQALKGYSVYYLDQIMLIASTVTLVIYALYIMKAKNHMLVYTVPVITLGLFRYYFLTHSEQKGEPADDILQDKLILASAFLYFVIVFLSFFLGKATWISW